MGGTDLRYRADLDGLRAIAVLSVVLYHLGVDRVSGGYVGVDIFFVLSGFLITQVIASDLYKDRFSFLNFYERRVRRIAPALIVVCAATTAAAFVILMPDELKYYAPRLIAALFSVSNIVFAHASYFSPKAGTQPLLHTWSLGVEEQFYILFPIILVAAYTYRRQHIGAIFWTLLLVSLAVSAVLVETDPRQAFFGIHARAWELLLGSVIALGFVPAAHTKGQREVAGVLGVLAIAAAVFLYSDDTPFPGLAALLPCLGAALVIWSGGGDTVVARALSVRPVVFIGLISYSLYLWHWPLIVYARLLIVRPFTPLEQTLLAAAAFALAILSWRYVETPFRRRDARGFGQKTVFFGAASGLSALTLLAIAVLGFKGFPQRFGPDVIALASASEDKSPVRKKCHYEQFPKQPYAKSCVLGAAADPKVIVYGDSHGAELSFALASRLKERNESLRELTASACSPGVDATFPNRAECAAYNERVMAQLKTVPPATIVIASNASTWARRDDTAFKRGLKETMHALRAAGHSVVYLGPAPNHLSEIPMPGTLARNAQFGRAPGSYLFDPDVARYEALDRSLRDIANSEGAQYVSLFSLFCSERGCRGYVDGNVMFMDDDHISVSGEKMIVADYLGPALWPPKIAVTRPNGEANGPATLPR